MSMKKILLGLLVPTLALMAACGSDDEPAKPSKFQIEPQDMALLTLNATTGELNNACKAQCDFTVDEGTSTADITIHDAFFDARMPYGVNFIISDVRAAAITHNGDDCSFKLSAASATMINPTTGESYAGYEITDVNGHIDTARGIYHVTFTVKTRGASYKVVATSTTLRTAINDKSYENTGELYYEYNLIDLFEAEIYIHNVQFNVGGASSPKLPKIHIPDLVVVPTATGYKLTGDGIIPNNITAGGPVPMSERFVVTNFEATLNVLTGEHHIYFNCMGGEHDGNAPLAL